MMILFMCYVSNNRRVFKIELKVVCKMRSLRSDHSLKNYSFIHIACVCVLCVRCMFCVCCMLCVCKKISYKICHRIGGGDNKMIKKYCTLTPINQQTSVSPHEYK